MSTATLPAPTTPDVGDEDDVNHIYCCRPHLSMCGMDISGREDIEDDWDDADDCPMCVDEDDNGAPCAGRPFCPRRWNLRRWLP